MAAEKASIASFIHTLTKGYDTKLSDLIVSHRQSTLAIADRVLKLQSLTAS